MDLKKGINLALVSVYNKGKRIQDNPKFDCCDDRVYDVTLIIHNFGFEDSEEEN